MDKKAKKSTQATSQTSRPSRKRNQTQFYFEESVKELEEQMHKTQKKQKLDAFSNESEDETKMVK